MEKNVLTYKDYISTINFSSEDDLFHGKIEGIDDLVSFEGRSVDELKTTFEEAVEEYFETFYYTQRRRRKEVLRL